jgi:hypothetical protein
MARGQGKRLAAALRRYWQQWAPLPTATGESVPSGARLLKTSAGPALNRALDVHGTSPSAQLQDKIVIMKRFPLTVAWILR